MKKEQLFNKKCVKESETLNSTNTAESTIYKLFSIDKKMHSDLDFENPNCIAMIFPFYVDKVDISKVIKRINRLNKSGRIESYLNDKMRFYNYVTQNYGRNEDGHQPLSSFIRLPFDEYEKNLNGVSCKIRDILLELKWFSTSFNEEVYKTNSDTSAPSLKPQNIRLFISSSGVGFVSLFFVIEDNLYFEEYKFKFLYDKFKETAKHSLIQEYICNLVKFYANTDISFFEKTHVSEKSEYIRALFFCNITCKKMPKLPAIPLWVTGHNIFSSLTEDSYYKLLKNRTSLVQGNTVDSSVEGCMVINRVDVKNDGLRNYFIDNVKTFCQHIFVSYIIAQHQYFCLHHLTQQAAKIKDKKHFDASTLYKAENYIKSFAIIRKNYSFNHVSMVEKYQNAYENIEKSLNIDSFIKETNYTLEPIQLLAEKNVERKKAGILSILSSLTLFNILISILKITYGENFGSEWLWLPITITGALMLFLTLFVTPNRVQRFIISSFENVSKKGIKLVKNFKKSKK